MEKSLPNMNIFLKKSTFENYTDQYIADVQYKVKITPSKKVALDYPQRGFSSIFLILNIEH